MNRFGLLATRYVTLVMRKKTSFPSQASRSKKTQKWQGTIHAQKAMSAVLRTGQRFGVIYLVHLLMGRTNDRMLELDHHKLPTFGVGSDTSEEIWRSVFRQLIDQRYLVRDPIRHGGLRVTETGILVLKGDQEVVFVRESSSIKKNEQKFSRASPRKSLWPKHQKRRSHAFLTKKGPHATGNVRRNTPNFPSDSSKMVDPKGQQKHLTPEHARYVAESIGGTREEAKQMQAKQFHEIRRRAQGLDD